MATMPLNLSEAEMAVLDEMSERLGLSKTAVVRQALRLYQIVDRKVAAGERMFYESAERKAELLFIP